MIFLSLLYCSLGVADSVTGLVSGLGEVESAARQFEDAARRYERNFNAQNSAMEQLRERTERYRTLEAKYDGMTKYTSQSGSNSLDRAQLQQQIRETANTLETLNRQTSESYKNALESGRKFRAVAFKNKVNPYAGSMSQFVSNPTARQIQYVLNGQALKVEASEQAFRGIQMTQQMEKPKIIEKVPEKMIEIKVSTETRTMNVKVGEFLVMRTTNDGLVRAKIEGFTPKGDLVVRNILPPAISNMGPKTPYVMDFTKIAEVTTFNAKQAPPLELEITGPKRQTLRLQPTHLQRFTFAYNNHLDKLKSPQTGNAPNTIGGSPRTGVTSPGISVGK